MADTNVAVNNDFELLTNPALMEYWGSKLSLPGLNLRINDPRGNYYGINTFTTGLTLDLRAMKLAAGYALDSQGKHQFGLGLTFNGTTISRFLRKI